MSRTIDERIVEMKFDNKQFESGAKESIGTLKKLKESLNFDAQTKELSKLNQAVNNVKMDGIAAGVEQLAKRFTYLGEFKHKVVDRMTDGLLNLANKGIGTVIKQIESGGVKRAMNIENAHFQLQSLLKDEQRVQEVMDSANKSVDGTAYSFDVAAKAASQFTASGITDINKLDTALRATVGTAATYNADYTRMAMIFTQVAGKGRLMGDEILQLSNVGANAAVTIKDFMNGINDGSIEADENLTAVIKNITGGIATTEADVRDMASKGKISFDLFASAMDHAFGDSAAKANETFTGALSNIKAALSRIGAGFVSPLIEQNSEIVKLFNAVRLKINDVKKALVFDEEIGNVNALSKVVTDKILSMAGSLSEFISDLNLTKPLQLFYNGVKVVTNVLKGLMSVITPIGKALRDSFSGSWLIDALVSMSGWLAKITENFHLSEAASNGFYNALMWLFESLKKVGSAISTFVKNLDVSSAFKIFQSAIGGMLVLIGNSISDFSKWVDESNILGSALEFIGGVINGVSNVLATFAEKLKAAFEFFKDRDYIGKTLDKITSAIEKIGLEGAPNLETLIGRFKELGRVLSDFAGGGALNLFEKLSGGLLTGVDAVIEGVGRAVDGLWQNFKKLEDSSIVGFLENVAKYANSIIDAFTGKTSVREFTNDIQYLDDTLANSKGLKEYTNAFDTFKAYVNNAIAWFNQHVMPAFDGLSFGGVASAAIGLGVIKSVLQLSEAFKKVSGDLSKSVTEIARSIAAVTKAISDNITKVLDRFNGVLKAYQNQLNAKALKDVAIAIGILAASLVALSFVDSEKLLSSALALGGVAIAIMLVLDHLAEIPPKTTSIADALTEAAKGLKSALSDFGKSMKIKAIGSMVKSMATSILMIVGSIVAIGAYWRKDAEAFKVGATTVGVIAVAINVMIVAYMKLSDSIERGAKGIKDIGTGIALIALSLSLVVNSLRNLFKMELPSDWITKAGLLGAIIAAMALLAKSLAKDTQIIGQGKMSATPILAMAASLILVVKALDSLFKIDFSNGWILQVGILAGIFVGLGALMKTIAEAGRIAGGSIKATGTILAMCAFIGTATAALAVLTILPGDKLLVGALALGGVLVALAYALEKAGSIADPKVYKVILSMAVMVGTITISLGVLSMIKWQKLLTGASALGGVLWAVAQTLQGAAGATDKASWLTVGAMCVETAIIAGSLVVLATMPWEGLVSAAGSLGLTILAVAKAFDIVANADTTSLKQVGLFVASTLALVPIGVALYTLSTQPWDGMLASAAALSGVILAYSAVFRIISGVTVEEGSIAAFLAGSLAFVPIAAALWAISNNNWASIIAAGGSLSVTIAVYAAVFAAIQKVDVKEGSILNFLALTLATAPIAIALYALAQNDWKSITAAGLVLSGTVAAYAAVFVLISNVIVNPVAIAMFLAGCIALLPVSIAIGNLAKEPWQNLLAAALALTAVLTAMVGVFGVVTIIGAAAPAAIAGMALLAAFVTELVAVFAILGEFAKDPTFVSLIQGGGGILADIGTALGTFVGNIVGGALGAISASFPQIGANLSLFMVNATPFFVGAKMVDQSAMEGVAALAKAILLLTAADILSGLTSWLTGGSNLVKFGEELASFGPYFSKYYESVRGIDGGVIQSSANAASALAEMANTLPASGGLAQKLLGERHLSEFAQELMLFGPAMAMYGMSIKGLDPEAVTASANAAKALAEMANTLPPSDGLAQKIFGERDLSEFAKELVLFGPSMALYSASIANVKPDAVIASANAAKSLAELANNLPNSGGLVAFFTGDNDIGAFGKSLVTFGESFSEYSQSVSGVDTSKLAYVVLELKKLVDIAQGISSVDTSGMSRFSMDLKNLAGMGLTGFTEAFDKASEQVDKSVEKLIGYVKSGFEKRLKDFNESGTKAANALAMAFDNTKIHKTYTDIGLYVVKSLAQGVTDNVRIVTDAGTSVGSALENSIRNQLDIHSISPKIRKQIGQYVPKSLIAGVEDGLPGLKEAGEAAGTTLINAVTSKTDLVSAASGELTTALTQGLDLNQVYDAFGGLQETVDTSTTNLFDNLVKNTNTGNEEVKRVSEAGVTSAKTTAAKHVEIQNERILSEDAYWAKLLEIKRNGAEAEKYAEMTLVDFQKSVLSETVETLQNYRDQLESTTESIMGSMNVFDEVSRKEAKSKEEITENLASQVRLYEEYTDTLNSLNERLGDSDLGKYLRTLSVDSIDQLQVLNSMTDEELSYYAGLYDDRMGAATEAAAAQLYGLRTETEAKLGEIFGTMNAQVNLYDFAAVFDGSLQSIEGYVTGLQTKFEQFGSTANELGMAIPTNIATGVGSGMDTITTTLNTGIGTALSTIATDQVAPANDAGKSIATNLDAGIAAGMTESTAATESAKVLMDNITAALAAAGEIHSPSLRSNREIGVPIVQGIGVAMVETTEPLTTGAETLSQTLITSITSAISARFSDITGNMRDLATTIATGIKENLPQTDIVQRGKDVVQWIIDGIGNTKDKLFTTAGTVCKDTVEKFKKSLIESDFKPNGVNIITWIMQGMDSMMEPLETGIGTIVEKVIAWFENKFEAELERLQAAGRALIEAIKAGIEEVSGPLVTTCQTISSNVINTLSGSLTYEAGYRIGANFSSGLAAGIASRRSSGGDDDDDDPVDSAGDLAEDVETELENDLEINSPSKVSMRAGRFFSEGLAIGIRDGFSMVRNSITEMTTDSTEALSDAIATISEIMENEDFDVNPTITPKVDLTEVRRGALETARLFNTTYDLSSVRSQALGTAAAINATKTRVMSENTENQSKTTPVEQKFEFVQNNYSPKALSRSEIYRQTNNQFAAFKNSIATA